METDNVPTNARDEYSALVVRAEKQKLQKHFGRFDILWYLLCTLVGLDTIGQVAKNGAQGFTWMAFLAVFFFLPYGLLTAELGSTFTDEGGPYVWTRLAFGRLVGAITALLYWVSNPIWLGGMLAITAVTAFETFFWPLKGLARYVFPLAFIWIAVLAAVLSFRVGKWLPTIGAWARLIVIPFFTFSVILYALRHGLHGFSASGFEPTYATFIALVPVLVFNYVGFELPSAAGEEMKDPQRDVPFTIARSAIGAVLLYGLPVLAILLVLPQKQVTGLSGFLDAIKVVFTIYGGSMAANGKVVLTGAGQILGAVMGAAFIWALASSGATWLMGADRAQAAAALEGAGPAALGRFSARFGTPIAVNLLSGVVSTIVMVLATELTRGNAEKYFQAVLGLAVSTATISYLAIFPALIRLRSSQPDALRPFRIPGGPAGVWICGGLTTFWAGLAALSLLWPGFGVGWFGGGASPDASLPTGFSGHRWDYEMTQLIPLGLLLCVGAIFYALGRDTRARADAGAV